MHLSQVHQPIKNCTNQSRIAPTNQELYQPRGRTICSVGAAETAALPGCASTEFRCLGCVSIRSGGLRPPRQAENNHNCDLVLRRPETSAMVGTFKNSFHTINPLSMFSASESVVKKHAIFCVFLLFYLFIPLLLLANIIQESFREKTHSIETERGTKSCVPILKGGALVSSALLAVLIYRLLCWFTACCVGLRLAVLVYGLLRWFTACCVGALETSAPPGELLCSEHEKAD